jgi:hypothetical protein
MRRHRTRRPGSYTRASLDAIVVADGTDDPIAALLLQAAERGLSLSLAPQPPALGSSGASTRAIAHPRAAGLDLDQL